METVAGTSTASAFAAPKGSDKIWCMLSHLSAFFGFPVILPLVVYLAMRRDSEYVACNSRESLNFHISVIIYGICCLPLVLIFIGVPLLVLLGVASFIVAIIAAVKAADGQCYHYPLIFRLVT
jgi:uncharacterized Tic20 family protein